jgi:hypothetical protein
MKSAFHFALMLTDLVRLHRLRVPVPPLEGRGQRTLCFFQEPFGKPLLRQRFRSPDDIFGAAA